MPRAAGNSSHYSDEIWRPHYTGPQDERTAVIRALPSVTHIIKSTVANPVLVGWAYRTTRDTIAGLVSTFSDNPSLLHEEYNENGMTLLDILSDADVLEELLKENKLTMTQITKMHADRGTAEHWHLEELTKVAARDYDASLRLAERYMKSANGWRRGIGAWWYAMHPRVLASERVLPHPNAGYCGSVDLIWETMGGALGITDLKTRLDDREAYDSDEFQVDAYADAWVANGGREPDFRAVLVVREDGTVLDHRDFTIERGSFSKVLDLYNARKGGGEE
jgi:hypothetical protein